MKKHKNNEMITDSGMVKKNDIFSTTTIVSCTLATIALIVLGVMAFVG